MARQSYALALFAGATLLGIVAATRRRPRYARRVSPVTGAPPPTVKGSYLNRRSETHRHRGIDLHAAAGDPVYATEGGVVTHAGPEGPGFRGYGPQLVTIEHGGAWTLYGHLDGVRVRPGDRVERGDVLGQVAAGVVPPHVHFEAARRPYPMASEAARIDPAAWLRGEVAGDHLPGGLADGKTAADFNAADLAAGAAVEMEHTNDPNIAREIATDHLVEDRDYYRKLARMEALPKRPTA